MKQIFLTFILGCMCSIACIAQTPKYGVVDIDSALSTIPEIQVVNHKVDSIYNAAAVALEPLQKQMQTYQSQFDLMDSNDTIAVQQLNEDAQLTSQEMNIIQQKANRAINALIQQIKPYQDKIQQLIQEKGEELNLTLIMPKVKNPVYTKYGPMVFDSPWYFSGEAIDITQDIIKAINPPTNTNKNAISSSPNRSSKK